MRGYELKTATDNRFPLKVDFINLGVGYQNIFLPFESSCEIRFKVQLTDVAFSELVNLGIFRSLRYLAPISE